MLSICFQKNINKLWIKRAAKTMFCSKFSLIITIFLMWFINEVVNDLNELPKVLNLLLIGVLLMGLKKKDIQDFLKQ